MCIRDRYEPAGFGLYDLGGAVRIDRYHRQAAGHRLDEYEPERFRDRGKNEQIGRVHRLRQLLVVVPTSEEGLIVTELADYGERMLAFPLAGVAADEHERSRGAEALLGALVRCQQERNTLDRRETADEQEDRLCLLERPKLAPPIADGARPASLVPAVRLGGEPAMPEGETFARKKRPRAEEL